MILFHHFSEDKNIFIMMKIKNLHQYLFMIFSFQDKI